jgi:hypothetical protein
MALTQEEILKIRNELGIPQEGFSEEETNTTQDRITRRQKLVAEQRAIDNAKKVVEERKGNKATGFLKDFGKEVVRSSVQTGSRFLTSLSPTAKMIDPTGAITKSILPEKVETPLGEIGVRTQNQPLEEIKMAGEDLLNVLPGGTQTKTAVKLAEQGAKGFAGKLMKSAFRISENDLKKRPDLIKDFLVERISGLTKRGIASKADAAVDTFKKQIDTIVKEASEQGKTVDSQKASEATEQLVKYYENSPFPEYADIVKKKVARFLEKGKMPIKEAQEFKENTYRILKESGYGQMQGPEKETAKQIARGIKEGIEEATPGYATADINKKIAIYGKARDLMSKRINKAGPNELVPLKDIVLTGATGSLIPTLVRLTVESVPFKTYVAKVLTSKGTQTLKNVAKITAPFVKSAIKSYDE